MALSADTLLAFETGYLNDVPASATVFYKGGAIGMTSGYARKLVAGDAFAGFCEAACDNSAGSPGDIRVRVRTKGLAKVTLASVAVTSINSPVYMSADDTFTLVQGSNSLIGYVYRYVTTDTCIVAFDHVPKLAAGASDLTLAGGKLFVGNASNIAAERTPSGDITCDNSGAFAIGNGKVTNTMLASANQSALLSSAKSYVTSHVYSSAH